MPRIFQTAPVTPTGAACRTFQIPNSLEWLGIFNALYPLMVDPYNWEQVNDTDLTIEESIETVKEIWTAYWNTTGLCDGGCTLPDLFTPPFRLGVNGRFEQLLPDGTWGTPAGEYEIPPTPAREEPTADERKCAAAANAAHVMFLLYEAITDEIALGGDTLQVAAAMVAALVTAVGGWIAAPVYAIIQLTIALFAGMIELLQALGSDVWTEEFNDKIMCAFLKCAADDGDVVTFDLACIREELATPVDLLSPTLFYDQLLFAQVLFLLETITMDGLNAAGATTAVTGEDCVECEIEWAACFDFLVSDGEWTQAPCYTNTAYSAAGWGRIDRGIVGINRTFAPTRITSFGIVLDQPLTGNYHRMFWVQDGDVCTDPSNEVDIGASVEWGIYDLTGFTTSLQILFQNNTPDTSNPLDYHIVKVNVNGIGYNPFEDYPPCEE